MDVRSENFQSPSVSGEAGFPWSGLSWSAAGRADVLRTVTAFYPVSSGDVRSGQVRSLRREDGRLDLYDYALTDGIWTETVTHLHEQSPKPVSGKTTRDTTLTNCRGETVERKTEAFIDGSWYTIARDRMTYNTRGKRIRSENLAGQVTTTAWDYLDCIPVGELNSAVKEAGVAEYAYEHAPFGALTISRGESAASNPWRFSSEFAEDDTATVYYNYRHYEPVMGRWLERDPISEAFELNVYLYCGNDMFIDLLGLLSFDDFKGTPDNDSPHGAKLHWTLTSDPGEIKVELKVRYTGSQCEDAIRAPGQKCPCKKCYIYKANLPNYKLIGSYDGSLSWVKDSDRDDSALLKHEQIHLRIEQKEAEKRAEEFRKIWVDGAKCCLWEAAYDSAVKALETEAESFFNKAYSEIEAIQKKYDEETDHGTNHEKQDEYNKEYQ